MQRYRFCVTCLALLVGVFLWFLLHKVTGGIPWARDSKCADCHSGAKARELGLADVYAKFSAFQFKHSVVQDEKCGQCHIVKGLNKTGRIWEMSSQNMQKEQLFFFKDLSWDRQYKIDLKINDDAGREISDASLQFKPSEVADSVDNDQKSPVIKDVEVGEIKQSVFLEATIKWETDEPASSTIEYGLTPEYGEKFSQDRIFGTSHKVKIAGLKRDKRYHYRIIAQDIFGNTVASGNFVFDVSREIIKEGGVKASDGKPPVVRGIDIFRVKGMRDVYLKVSSDKPVLAYLRVEEPAEMDKHGFGLASQRYSNIDVCVKCHSQGVSHPVGMRSKGLKTKIPPELPTIEGGVMTCVTCHTPHGGTRRYFARRDFKRDLCITCHLGNY